MRAVVVDDEPLARERILAALERHPDVEVVGVAGDGEEAIDRLRELGPDLVFLDVRMPGPDGFALLRALKPDERPLVVFVTAFGDRAVEAFRVHALDYLVKPFDDADFDGTVERVRERLRRDRGTALEERLEALLAEREAPGAPARPRFAARVRVRDGPRTSFLPVERIRWIGADGNHVVLHTAAGEHRVRTTLTGLLERLDPSRFVRIHRSTAVNLDALREVQPWFSGDWVAILDDGEELRVSRSYRDDVLRLTH